MKIIKNEASEYNLTAADLVFDEGGAYESNEGDVYIVTDEQQIVSLANGTLWKLDKGVARGMDYRKVDAAVSY